MLILTETRNIIYSHPLIFPGWIYTTRLQNMLYVIFIIFHIEQIAKNNYHINLTELKIKSWF